MIPFVDAISTILADLNINIKYSYNHKDLLRGDVCFILGYPRIIPPEILQKHQRNLVVHASDLPKGRGMSPWVWDVLQGENKLTICLLEANEKLDEGNIIYKEHVFLSGTELIDDLRKIIGNKTIQYITDFLSSQPFPKGTKQEGEPTYYKKRNPEDSQLDINKTIAEQFNLLRVVDNDNYPAFFEINGKRFKIKIEKMD